MKKRDIEAIYTAKVQEYFAKGYTINAQTMSGSQGEIAKIDVRKGDEVIRIMIESTGEWNAEEHRNSDAVVLTVGRVTMPGSKRRYENPFDTMRVTIWRRELEIVEARTFYQIRRDNDFFTEDYAEYCAMQDKQIARFENRASRPTSTKIDMQGKAKEIAARYIKRKLGKSRVSTENITVTKHSDSHGSRYYIKYFSQCYKLA